MSENEKVNEEIKSLLNETQNSLDLLNKKFDQKIKSDEYKNALFDNLHQELTKYRNGEMEKISDAIALEIIQLKESYEKKWQVVSEKEETSYSPDEMKNTIHEMVIALEDILYRQGYDDFSCEGEIVDVKKQKIVGFIETSDETSNNHIGKRLAVGYEKGDRVVYKEKIKIFKYRNSVEK